jgi:hypothetical protein
LELTLPPFRRSARPHFWPLLVLCALLLLPRAARADQVDKLIGQLQGASDYKVRLSAALNLAKIGDKRAIPVFIKALKDSDKTVRGVAAAGLGKLVTGATSKDTRSRAMAALKATAGGDRDGFVRKQAQKAYDQLRRGGGGGGGSLAAGSTYVNIGGMAAQTSNAGAIKAVMRQAVQRAFRQSGGGMVTEWPGGGNPSAGQLRGINAFHVDGTVNEIRVSGGMVECKVSMLLATYPEKSMFGFLKGGAKVDGGGDSESASQDCVAAVAEDLIARKIIPTIRARAGQ